ncbi:MAG: nicotinate phosphoribosyltransferase [Clostridium sp. SCN 57-10]|nr:MAG: nicotinate phosphoribosyltransferase [Clostridium sp. SCN 57-10]
MRATTNFTMLTDFYEFTMANGYLKQGVGDRIAYFDMFFRRIPDGGGYAIMAGVEQLVQYLRELEFDNSDIAYLRSKGCFCEEFLDYLKNFQFCCDVWAVPEGAPIFPGEPIVTVRGPVIQAQFIETMVLLTINHQSLIATKASRMVRAAEGRAVLEFGARRAQGTEGAVLGARAAYIGGAAGTSCVLCDQYYKVPAAGTMAHSWVQLFDTEYEAFKAYAEVYPDDCTLLIDTYNVLQSGVPNAIRTAREVLEPMGKRLKGIRIDSGDIAYLTKKTRRMLDEAGLHDCKIVISNSLDEFLIRDLIMQGAQIDSFGVGERLITSRSEPVFGGVYKLAGIEDTQGNIIPKIKISENVEKITNPHFKRVWRLSDNATGKFIADVITLHDEVIDSEQPYTIFDPEYVWKRKTLTNFSAEPLLQQLFDKGECVYLPREIREIRSYCLESVARLWGEIMRFENPHRYYVDLSQKLWDVKRALLERKEH